MTVKTDPSSLTDYVECGWQLIPLHSHDYFDQHKGKKRARGKSPLHPNWPKRIYKSADQTRHLVAGNNVGVRLRKVTTHLPAYVKTPDLTLTPSLT